MKTRTPKIIGIHMTVAFLAALLAIGFCSTTVHAQASKWMSVGSLHNWYSELGCEIEEGRALRQQDGLRWPAIYKHQDMQCAKSLWIGIDPFTYPSGETGPYVVHVGPRVRGIGEFIPLKPTTSWFKMISQYEPPVTIVNGNQSDPETGPTNDAINASLPYERVIENVVNTATGITMTRKIIGFSQQWHDNYIIYDHVFKNTGNTSETDTTVRSTAKILTNVWFFFQYRYAPCADTRYVIGKNPTGWGINTMNDSRGDGLNPASTFFPGNTNNDIRAAFAWHGKYPPFTTYDNIGGPIWVPYYDATDTVGRLGAAQFVGLATLHVDKSPTDTSNDLSQPATTEYQSSDDPPTSQNDHMNPKKNAADWAWMTFGHMNPRHADKVGAAGDPSQGYASASSPGGQSCMNGYGPYTLKPGQSIHIVQAEATAGLSYEACLAIGRAFKGSNGSTSATFTYSDGSKVSGTMTKNNWVYTGYDSLFQAFRRANMNYHLNYNIPLPPRPPQSFSVAGGAGKIRLQWTPTPGGATVKEWHVYRAIGRYDSAYHLQAKLPATTTVYDDTSAAIDVQHFYYLVAVGDAAANNGAAGTPAGALQSGRYYAQTYEPAIRRVAAPLTMVASKIRIVPNPYNISADAVRLRYPGEPDKITFKNIPGICTIRIYTELGELVTTLNHDDGTSTQDWYQTTQYKQIIVTGLYIAVFETPQGDKAIQKFVVIR